jgi:hypothetical protein
MTLYVLLRRRSIASGISYRRLKLFLPKSTAIQMIHGSLPRRR